MAWVIEGAGAGTGRDVTGGSAGGGTMGGIDAWEKKGAPDGAKGSITVRWGTVAEGAIAWNEKENMVGARVGVVTRAGASSVDAMVAC